jgi:hypothetical protein
MSTLTRRQALNLLNPKPNDMPDGLVTTLLENIKNNLEDTTNYSSIATPLGVVFPSGEFVLHPKASPYAVIVPGTPEPLDPGATVALWWQPVDVFLVMRRLKTKKGERSLLGTSSVNGLETLAKDTRQALSRESPYNNRVPSGYAGYTTQTGVLHVRFDGQEYMGEVEEEDAPPASTVVLHLAYLCAETR